MKIALTGGSGFVGSNLIPYLLSCGEEVSVLSREQINSREFALPIDAEAFIHLAGKAHDLKKTPDADEYYKVNFELTKKLFDAFLSSNAKIFIFLSSVKASADSVNGVLDEESVPNPTTHYGRSKLKAETYMLSKPLPPDKRFYILRPCMIHGPGNKGNLNLLYKFVKAGIPYPFASFDNHRSFLSVENLCFIIIRLLKLSPASGIYNLSDDGYLSTNQVVEVLAAVLGKKPRLLHIPKKLLIFLSRIGDRFNLPLNSDRLTKLTEDYRVNNAKIKAIIGEDMPQNAVEGLKLTVKSFGI
ncbi:NAD-dependent epimerase/dehydratase family protein [Pedobacter terrae]|uniref:NAD-dependent epimerase/dehydratase family protein n=1 Tax=Pedobacter terrae TaxID=405671 RepID=UPI002FF7AF90